MEQKSIKEFANYILSKYDGIGAIFIMIQYIEKELLLHLSKIENISYKDAKDFISSNHFNFMIGKFLKLTDQRFGKEFNKNLESLRKRRNFLVHDSFFCFLNKKENLETRSKDINKVFWQFIETADQVLSEVRQYTHNIKLEDNLDFNDFIYRDIFEKIDQFLKENYTNT